MPRRAASSTARAGRFTVCPRQPTRSQLLPTVVPGDDRHGLTNIAVHQDRQHGSSRGPMRLAIVAQPDLVGAPRRAGNERPAVVRGVGHLGRHLAHDALHLGGRCGVRQGAGEAAALHFEFTAVEAGRDEVPGVAAHGCRGIYGMPPGSHRLRRPCVILSAPP